VTLAARAWLAGLAGLACFPAGVSAHPHIWIEAQETLRFDSQGLIDAVLAHWSFDDLYSAFSLEGLDLDGDGAYTAAELEPMRSQMHSSLRAFGYFTTVTADGHPLGYADATELSLSVDGGVLVLDAVLPLAKPVDPRAIGVELLLFDPTYYVALSLAEVDPARLAGAVPAGCASVVDAPRDADQQAPTLSDDLATNADLARSYAMDGAPAIRVACS
jgi:ABC-type uncharacterized transport system substrate-binding protein